MDTFPNFNMYAVLKNKQVINIAFGIDTNSLVDYTSKPILNSNEFEFIQMNIDNSPAEIGMQYNGKTFSY